MASLPSITVDTSDFPAQSSIGSPPWNAYAASNNKRRVPSPALQYSSDTLSPPPLEEGTSQVGDYGDTKHLENPDRFAQHFSVSSTADAFVQVGSRFPETPDSGGLGPWDTRSTGGESISLRSNADSTPNLSDLIREKSRDAVDAEGRTFFPISDLEQVVTRTTARQELGNIPDLDAILDHIFLPRKVSDHKTRAFKIFVILILVGKPEAIRDFIDEETYDLDLPFERPTAEKTLKSRNHYIRNTQIPGRSHSEITTFRRWAAKDLDIFVEKQHAVCVPIFDFDSQPGAPVSHYNLHGQTIIPYIENEEHGLRSEGRSDVWRVKIHPAHAICPGIWPNMSLAVKQLKHRVGKSLTEESQNFHKEAKNLRRFASRDHDFIIKLLCTFQWRGHYYFLFPWADGNLYDFWIRHPAPLAPLKQPSTARWLSTQCLGLATALRDIHRGDSHSTLHLAPQRKNHGKHGDIKPENILYFISCGDECGVAHRACLAHLKISDLGEAEFHATTSMEVDAVLVSHTPSYSAPELRVKNVSMPNYDVFSLACVLLEFVKWYLHGFRGVDRFREKRLREQEAPVYGFNAGNLKVDGFFKHVEVFKDKSRHNGAMHKTSVNREIEQLCEDRFCSDYILDLLVFIKDHLLRLNPDNRADCDTIYKKFQELDIQCRNDEAYCVDRIKQAPARSTTDRSLIVDIDIKFPKKPRIEIIRGSQSGYQIRLVDDVDIDPSDPPHPRGDPIPAHSAPNSPLESPQAHPSRQLTPIEEIQVVQDVNRQQDRAVSRHNTAEAQDAAKNISNRQDNLPPINSSQSFQSSDVGRATDMLSIPSKRKDASSPHGSDSPGDDINSSENEGRSSTRSARRLFRRAPSEKERGDRGSIGVKERIWGPLRKAFCIS